jgi:hypothetical protein
MTSRITKDDIKDDIKTDLKANEGKCANYGASL